MGFASYNAPTPSKSAWFLLWTQELASYGSNYIYLIILVFIFYMVMPFLNKKVPENAVWFHKSYRFIYINHYNFTTYYNYDYYCIFF